MSRPEEVAADRFREELGVHGIPVDVERLAQLAGAQLVRTSLESSVSGLLVRSEANVILAVNDAHAPRRQRFTIAHELGHLQLHPGRPNIIDNAVRVNRRDDISSQASDTEEIAANAFAAALLMPERAVREAVASLRMRAGSTQTRVIEALADQFDVSTDAMGYRLINLGISS